MFPKELSTKTMFKPTDLATVLTQVRATVKDWLNACASSHVVDFMPIGIHTGVLGIKSLIIVYSPNTPVFAFIPFLLDYEKEVSPDKVVTLTSKGGSVVALGTKGLAFSRSLEEAKAKREALTVKSCETEGKFSYEWFLKGHEDFFGYEVRRFVSCLYLYLDSNNWLVVKKAGEGLISLHLASNEKPFPSIGRSSIYLPADCLLKDFLAAVNLIRSVDYEGENRA